MMQGWMRNLSVASVLLSTPFAGAFTLGGSSITGGWNKTELAFDVNEGSCTALGISASVLNDAIDEAVHIWNTAPTSNLKLKRGSVTTSTAASDPPVIYCTNSISSPDTTAGIGGINTLIGGRPASGSLQLNGDSTRNAYFGNLSVAQRQVVVAHEMGHVLGLGHSSVSYALMYYAVGAKESAHLSQDDVDAISWLNPRKEPKDGAFGCGMISANDGSGGGGGPGAPVTFALMLLLMWAGTRTFKSLGHSDQSRTRIS